ncbi:MAG TPA: hypothetical protein ACFYEK_01220 [Candidatus Wunengus sp. YC60]|uniref:hypothetical protein n=1 Tax=Candidatus Wunengus sp. YC60 TaxID=3367697 RepID=UPI00402A570D
MSEQKEVKKKPPYKGLLQEYGIVMALISDQFLDQVHAQNEGGLFEAIHILNEAAIDFYNKHKKEIENPKQDWAEICGTNGVPCYEHYVLIHCSRYMVNKYYGITLKLK